MYDQRSEGAPCVLSTPTKDNRRMTYHAPPVDVPAGATIAERARILSDRRHTLYMRMQALAETGRPLNSDESATFDALARECETLDDEVMRLDGQLQRDRASHDSYRRLAEIGAIVPEGTRTGGARVVRDASVYTPEGRHSFFCDLWRSTVLRSDPAAQDRLDRHQAGVESRDLTSGVTTGLVPPAYLVNEYAEIARAHRSVADIVRHAPLPERGMTTEIPKVTTGSTVASQSTENTSVSETDIAATTISVPTRTVAGMQDASRQLLERGDPGVDRVLFSDLAAAHAAEVERQVVNGSGSSGEMLGVLGTASIISTTYTDASPTLPELLGKLANAYQSVATQRYAPPSHVVMHPRRWAWMMAQLDTTNRPLVSPTANGPTNAVAVGGATAADGTVGTLLGLPVVISAQVPTNLGGGTDQDIIVVMRASDSLLMESGGGAPFELRFDQPLAHQLTVRLVIYSYCGFTAARQPKSIATIGGTGLAAPTF